MREYGSSASKQVEMRKRILVVDDDQALRLLIQDLLEDEVYEVDTAIDGVDALEQLDHQWNAYDVILLDLTMPRLNGLQFLQKVQEQGFPLLCSIIALSGDEEALQQAACMGIGNALKKPSDNRGKVNGLVMNFWPVGAMLAALVNLFFINLLAVDIGWRVGFAVGAIAAVFVLWMRRALPESPRWLLTKGRYQEAEAVVHSIETRAGQTSSSYVPTIEVNGQAALPFFAQVFELVTHYPGRLALGCLLDLSEAFGYYGMFAFLTLAVLPAVNIPQTQVPWFYFLGNVGALAGGLSMLAVIDRLGRKITVPAFYTLAAITAVLLAPATATHSGLAVLIAFMVANFFATGAWTSAYPTFSEIFPTHLRSTGIGLSVGVGRIGAAASAPLLIWIAQGPTGIPGAPVTLSILWLVGAIAMIPWCLRGVEGAGTPLEKMVACEC